MIQGAVSDTGVINAMKSGKNAIEQLNKQANVDDIADLKEELDDMMAENEEKQDYWAKIGNEGKEDLLAELDDLEAEMASKEMEEMDLAPQKIILKPKPVKKVEEAKEEEDEDEIELKKLMMS